MRTLTCLFILLSTNLIAQHLDVEGHSRIRGDLDINHMSDQTSINIGHGAGVNTVFTQERLNTILGVLAGNANTSGNSNTFIGYTAGQNNTDGGDNVFVGIAGLLNTSGGGNTFIGNLAGMMNTTGNLNTAIGFRALYSNTIAGEGGSGNSNVAIGAWALENANSRGNTALGTQTLRNLTDGGDNTAIGEHGLQALTMGVNNTAIGYAAMISTSGTSSDNVAVGRSAGENSQGSGNTYVGSNAGFNIKQGQTNTLLGNVTQGSDTTANNQIVIGYGADGVKDNSAVIGNSEVTDIYMAENSGAVIHAANAKLNSLPVNNSSDSIVVLMPDSTLAIRDASSLNKSPWYLGKDTLGGIVFYIYKGGDGQEHGLIVSKTESSAIWQNNWVLVNADRSWDGAYNMGLMNDSPAKNYIEGLGADWYLPSVDELSLLWHNRFHANKALHGGGYTLLSNIATYWSSTEDNNSSALTFQFKNGSMTLFTSTTKNSSYSVRAIRAF